MLLSQNTFDGNNNLVIKYRFIYSKTKKLVEKNCLFKDGTEEKITYIHDDKDNIIKETLINLRNLQNTERSFKYNYDKKGNWIEKIEIEKNIPKFIFTRDIFYY